MRTGWGNSGALGANSAVTFGPYANAYALGTTGAGVRQNQGTLVAGKTYRLQAWLFEGHRPRHAAAARPTRQPGQPHRRALCRPGRRLRGGWHDRQHPGREPRRRLLALELRSGARGGLHHRAPRHRQRQCRADRHPPWRLAARAAISGPAAGWSVDPSTGIVTFATAPPAHGAHRGFEFDVPVRFDSDELAVTLDLERLGSIASIPSSRSADEDTCSRAAGPSRHRHHDTRLVLEDHQDRRRRLRLHRP
ncbi:MAG: DUF2460 domain-containing protein [Exiguobacterium profundum]|nr:MAG: DUF2460 domain-containing protein [Exiguobacterium profundum]